MEGPWKSFSRNSSPAPFPVSPVPTGCVNLRDPQAQQVVNLSPRPSCATVVRRTLDLKVLFAFVYKIFCNALRS